MLGLGVVVGLSAGCTSPEDRAAYHIERGNKFLAEDKLAAAEIEFRSALNFDRTSVVANVELANLAEGKGNLHDAIFYLRDALAAGEPDDELTLRLATMLRDDEPWRARRLLMTALTRSPENPVVHLGLSQLELTIGQPDAALASARRAAELDPSIPGSYWQLGVIYESLIERAMKANKPLDNELRDNAVQAFDDFVTHGGEPEWKARLEQARILGTGQRNRERAIESARRALDVARQAGGDQPKLLAARHLSTVARSARDRAAYADATEALLEVTPKDFHSWKNLAEHREASGGSAEAVYRDLLSLFPNDPDAHALYARHIGLTTGYLAAVKYYERIIDEGFDRPRLLSSLRSYQIAYRMMRHAEETLARMQSEFPGDPWTRLEEAKKLSADGYSLAAIEELEVLASENEIPEALEVLARLESFRRKFEVAAKHARRAVELTGYYEIRLHRLLAEVLFDASEFAEHLEAIDVIEKFDDLTNEQLFSKAVSLYETDQNEEARKILLQIVEEPETKIPATLEFARREASNPQQARLARKLVIVALEEHPEDQSLLLAHADVNQRMGRPDLALTVLDGLKIRSFPSHVRYMRARLRAESGNIEGSLIDVSHSLRDNPTLPGLLDFAVFLYANQNLAATQIPVIAAWIDVIRTDDHFDWLTNTRKISQLHLLRSRLLHTLNHNQEAIAVLEHAISNFEFVADTRIDLAYLLAITEEDADRAIEIAQQVADTEHPDPRALDALGFAYLTAKQPLDALQQFRLANAKVSNTNALFLYHESIALRDLGREQDALEAIDRVIALDPTFPRARELRQSLIAMAAETPEPS